MNKLRRNALTQAEIDALLEFCNYDETYPPADSRRSPDDPPDYGRRSTFTMDTPGLPVDIITKLVSQELGPDAKLQIGYFFDFVNTATGLHFDTDQAQANLHSVIIIPLKFEGECGTVFFSNYWNGPRVSTLDPTIIDYNKIVGYDDSVRFDPQIHEKWIKGHKIDDLHGLTFDETVIWEPNSVIVFPRRQLHGSAKTHVRKTTISLFTEYSN